MKCELHFFALAALRQERGNDRGSGLHLATGYDVTEGVQQRRQPSGDDAAAGGREEPGSGAKGPRSSRSEDKKRSQGR